jgi:hypothetical protein
MKQEPFEIKAYYKSELAMIYYPKMTRRGAIRRLNNWLKKNRNLSNLLELNDFTPSQVQQIVDEFGEPYEYQEANSDHI